MKSDKDLNVGCLEFCTKNGKTLAVYNLKVGSNIIGASLSADIRIKSRSNDNELVFCVINVKDNGLATLEKACKGAVFINGSKVSKMQVLKNKDKIDVAEKSFLYVNKNRVPTEVVDSIKTEKRYSVMPSFKMKTLSKIPLSINKNKLQSHLSTIKSKEISRRSCMSALPNRRRSRLSPWETIATPNGKRSLRPSTSMQSNDDLSMTVRKALFLKNKADISFADPYNESNFASFVTLQDSVLTEFEETKKSRRGIKRRRDSSIDDVLNVNKRQKHSEDQLIFLSISGCESLFEDSGSSLYSSVQDSPLATALKKMLNSQNSPLNDLSDVRGVKKLLKTPTIQKSPVNDLTDLRGVKKIRKTPKIQKSPRNDLTDVRGVKKILKTPRIHKSPTNDLTDVKGVKKILKTPRIQKSPTNDLTDVRGVKKLLKTPKVQKPPTNDLTDVRGVKRILKTPTVQKSPMNDLTNVRGVKKILRTPKVQKSPLNDLTQVQGLKKLMNTPKQQNLPLNDLTNVKGIKKLMKTPKAQKSPQNDLTDIKGVKKLFNTYKQQKSPVNDLRDVRGVKKLLRTPKEQKSPVNDLTDVKGVKKMLRTPKNQKSPKNDLRNISGIKRLMKTPKLPKSPLNDLTNISGVHVLFQSPKVQKSPLNDLSRNAKSVNKRVKTQKHQKSPKNDLSNVMGVKRLLRTPRVQKSPINNLSDLRGVKKLLKSPKGQKSPNNDLSDVEGVKELMATDQTLNNTLEEVFQQFLNDPNVHNSTQKPDSPKIQNDVPTANLECRHLEQFITPNLQKSSNESPIQVSQRGRRIRLKRFDDDFIGLPSPMKSKLVLDEAETSLKRSTRSHRQQQTVEQQVSTNDEDAETPNLKKDKDDEMPVLKRNTRGRKKNTVEESDIQNETKRGRNKKIAVDEQPDNNATPQAEKITENEEIVVPKRGVRGGRKKNVVEEVKEASTEIGSPNVTEQEVQTRGRGRKKNVDEETTNQRSTRGKTRKANREMQVENQTVEESDAEVKKTPVQKRSTRGRKKIEETKRENNEVTSKKPTTRGRKRKNVEEIKEQSIVATPEVSSVDTEENDVPQKRQARGRGKKNIAVNEMEVATPELPKTRTRKETIGNTEEVPKEQKKTRVAKRRIVEENANHNESSENEKKTKVTNYNEGKEDTKIDEISPMKTRRGRKTNVQTKVELKPMRRKTKK